MVDDFGRDTAHFERADSSQVINQEYGVVALADLQECAVFVGWIEHVAEHGLDRAGELAGGAF